VVVVQTCAAVDVRCVSFPAGGRAELSTFVRPGSEMLVVPAEAGCSLISGDLLLGRRCLGLEQGSRELGRGSLKLVQWRSCSAVRAATWRETFRFPAEDRCCRGWTKASERRLGCDLGDTVRTVGCGVQAALGLAGEDGQNVGGG
jgi:hypothetical protein